jgi:hypothetical protein
VVIEPTDHTDRRDYAVVDASGHIIVTLRAGIMKTNPITVESRNAVSFMSTRWRRRCASPPAP